MDLIELGHGPTKAIIDLQGAWITNLSDDKGDIFFPRRSLTAPDGTQKIRGGCHICLPNFGPGGDSGLPQHGFGRISLWEVVEKQSNKTVLMLKGGAAGYEDLVSTLTVALGESQIAIELQLKNKGETTFRVAPAFHPYFSLQATEEQVEIDEETTLLSDLAGTVFESGKEKRLRIRRRSLRLASKSLSTWAIWTDKLGPYICVEPTVGGYTFLAAAPSAKELLRAGNACTYSFTIAW